MIDRYSRKELRAIWSEENKYKIWLDIEIAAAQAMEKYKIIPKGVSSIVKKKANIKVKRIHEIEAKNQIELLAIGIGHDVTKYYERSITINRAEDLGETLLEQLTGLFA